MDLTATSGVPSTYTAEAATVNSQAAAKPDTTNSSSAAKKEDSSVVYEKSTTTKKDSANQIYNRDNIIAKLKKDQESRMTSMQNLVQKLLNKQGSVFDLANGTNLAATFCEAAANADPDTIKAAQEAISDDGYWGIKQTSDRMVSMAIALTGGDTDKADEMISAIEKGFKQATKSWGEDLPDICQKTLEETKKKMNDWKNGVTTAADYSDYLS